MALGCLFLNIRSPTASLCTREENQFLLIEDHVIFPRSFDFRPSIFSFLFNLGIWVSALTLTIALQRLCLSFYSVKFGMMIDIGPKFY